MSWQNIILEKAKFLGWKKAPSLAGIFGQIVFDLHDLLPNENVEAFLLECLKPPHWGYVLDDDEKSWFCTDPYEQRLWYVQIAIPGNELGRADIELVKKNELEQAMLSLVDLIEEAVNYTTRKTPSELSVMYAKFRKIKEDGLPKNDDYDYDDEEED